MRKIILSTPITLDGFIAGPNDNLDWVIADRQLHEEAIHLLNTADLEIFGRKTYELMVNSWPTISHESSFPDFMIEFANKINPMKKIVFSKTLQEVGWNTTLIHNFNPEEIIEMKKLPGKNILIGGANLAQQFIEHNLIDEFQLLIHPVILGNGKQLFTNLQHKVNLKLIQSKTFGSGVISLRYEKTNHLT